MTKNPSSYGGDRSPEEFGFLLKQVSVVNQFSDLEAARLILIIASRWFGADWTVALNIAELCIGLEFMGRQSNLMIWATCLSFFGERAHWVLGGALTKSGLSLVVHLF